MKKRFILVAFYTAIISGCATESYVAPAGPIATFTTPSESNYQAYIFTNNKQCQNEAMLSSAPALLNTTPGKTTAIPANQLVTIRLGWVGDKRTCDAVVSFTPQANQAYTAIATANLNGLLESFSKGTGECKFTILNAKTHQPISVAVRHYQRPPFSTWECSDNLSGAAGATPIMQTVPVSMTYHS
jgi:hypothetical protein